MDEEGRKCVALPRLVQSLVGKKVVAISAGDMHTAVCTADGELYTFGAGYEGQCGHGSPNSEVVPRRVKALTGENVVGVSCGDEHTMALTDGGAVFTFGCGARHQLGHGGTNNELVPRRVEALDGVAIAGIDAGTFHSVAWTGTGELYTWGYGENGRLGHGGLEDEPLPRLVEALVGRIVKGVAAGAEHTVAWTDMGELLTWGNGGQGRLGHGEPQAGESPLELVPRVVQALAGQRVVMASAANHTIVLTAADQVRWFGPVFHEDEDEDEDEDEEGLLPAPTWAPNVLDLDGALAGVP